MGLLRVKPVLQTWGRILRGRVPSLSIEITRECPLRCPGCYAYEDAHLGTTNLRSLSDFKGDELVRRTLDVVAQHDPLHLSIVGGDPLVRYRELEVLLPQLVTRTHVQVVTSAFRPLPASWATLPNLQLVVSIDGLQPEHDARRKPATYERILKNIEGHPVTVHCTITRQMTGRAGYFQEFLAFWSGRPEVKKIWFSFFTPQVGAEAEEILSQDERAQALVELNTLRKTFSKLYLPRTVIAAYHEPPRSPAECIFARATLNFTADLKTKVTPCQFGGTPDCSRCGCIASAGLKAIGDTRLMGFIPVRSLYNASDAIGKTLAKH